MRWRGRSVNPGRQMGKSWAVKYWAVLMFVLYCYRLRGGTVEYVQDEVTLTPPTT